MPLSSEDTAFRYPRVSHLDFKQVEMDRVLTALFARVKHNGAGSRLLGAGRGHTAAAYREAFEEQEEAFEGFADYPDVAEAWIETHLMDVVNRGKPTQSIAAPRPLHGLTYRFRNLKHSRDYGAAQHLYQMLQGAERGPQALAAFKRFFFAGVDPATGGEIVGTNVDIETQALLNLSRQVKQDAPDTRGLDGAPPLLREAASTMAEDVILLLTYAPVIPRAVIVDHLKILLAIHLALYHLRLAKWLPALVRKDAHHGSRIGLLLDVVGDPAGPVARLAESSADTHYRRIPAFVHGNFMLKKLEEFAIRQTQFERLPRPSGGFDVDALLALRDDPRVEADLKSYFRQRYDDMLYRMRDEDAYPRLREIHGLGLPYLDAYVEAVALLRGTYHRRYIVDALDSLLLKNRPGALIAQPRARSARRRFVLDSRLLEVLLQLAVLRSGGRQGFHTEEMRLEEFTAWIQDRYGFYIDRLPDGDGFGEADVATREALRSNAAALRQRLREVGFYRDLSDAYVTQTITPRFTVEA